MISYLTIEEWITSVFFIIEDFTLEHLSAIDLDVAQRALDAPMAAARGRDLYPDVHDKAALQLVEMLQNPPGPDAYTQLIATYSAFVFLAGNGHQCDPPEHELVHWVHEVAGERLSLYAIGGFMREHCRTAGGVGCASES